MSLIKSSHKPSCMAVVDQVRTSPAVLFLISKSCSHCTEVWHSSGLECTATLAWKAALMQSEWQMLCRVQVAPDLHRQPTPPGWHWGWTQTCGRQFPPDQCQLGTADDQQAFHPAQQWRPPTHSPTTTTGASKLFDRCDLHCGSAPKQMACK